MKVVPKTALILILLMLAGLTHDFQHNIAEAAHHPAEVQLDEEHCLLQAQATDLTHAVSIGVTKVIILKNIIVQKRIEPKATRFVHFLTRGPPVRL